MGVHLVVPAIGESVLEATLGAWLVKDGARVEKDAMLVSLESEKATFELPAPQAGVLRILKQAGDNVPIGSTIGEIESVDGAAAPATKVAPPTGPAARALLEQHALDVTKVQGTGAGGRILKEDVTRKVQSTPLPESPPPAPPVAQPSVAVRGERVVRMTPLRKTVARRLVQVQNEAAILTTFNEADMSGVMALRDHFKDAFLKKHGVKLGFMGFFVKAAVDALKAFPSVNSEVRGDDMVFKEYFDIGVAVGAAKGLVVPVVRNADALGLAGLEKAIGDLGRRAQENKLGLEELQGGTFTISNGGVYGSMLSTPILNPPQTAILGMHNIMQRPVAVDGQVVVRPMMYLALSYDHRAIDGREAVQFLVRIKECVETPERLMLEV